MTEANQSQLGKGTEYDQAYSPDLLFPLARSHNRASLKLGPTLPFKGEDLWTCYELSWLDSSGKPQVGIAYFRFPANSPYMIESKSFKLYLNAINHLPFESIQVLQELIAGDLSDASGATVEVLVSAVNDEMNAVQSDDQPYICIDDLEVSEFEYLPNPELLALDDSSSEETSEFLCSHLLRSNCPVTGQPDWGTVYIHYSGSKIGRESLLRYIVSFRQCQDFHEHCVERIFTDLLARCQCKSLSVYARYTRRGGLDINPYRATAGLPSKAKNMRTARQ